MNRVFPPVPVLWPPEVVVKVLKEAKQRLAERKFVCLAISDANVRQQDKALTLAFVRRSIGGASTVFAWLHTHHPELLGAEMGAGSDLGASYRLAWVDHMIAELEKD